MRSIFKTAVLMVCLLAISFGTAQSIGSEFINYQGRLTNTSGTPQTGLFNITFRLYPTGAGGTLLWQESVPNVQVTDGIFTHLLGSGSGGEIPDSLFDLSALYLEVEVEGEIIGVRSLLTGVAVAKRVANIDGAIAGNVTGSLEITPGLSPSSFTIVGAGNDSIKIAPDDTLSIIGTDPDGNMTMALSTKKGLVSISLFDPVDSKDGLSVSKKRVEISPAGLVMFDSTGLDTTMLFTANDGELTISGDINTTPASGSSNINGNLTVSDTVFASAFSSNSPFIIDAPAGSNRIYISDITGSVGIGTTSPDGILAVSSDASTNPPTISDSRSFAQDVGGAISLVGYSDGSGGRSTFAQIRGGKENATSGNFAGYFSILSRPNGGSLMERVRVTSTGNVGIGTTSPGAKLHVSGTTRTNALEGDQTNDLNINNPNSINLSVTGATGVHSFNTNGSEKMRIGNSGEVGIGTSSPIYKLVVAGPVMMTGASTPGAVSGYSGIYSNSGELFALDAGGNSTQLSPHDTTTGEWIFYSKNIKTGRVVRVDMERLVKKIEQLTGEKFMMETIEKIEK